jgi:outer membrane protein assembly factor BamB
VTGRFYPAVKILSYVPILFLPFVVFADGPRDERHWAQWRGPLDTGVATTADPPVEWSETKNIKWKVRTVGHGTSSPIVWDDRIFLTTSIPHGEENDPTAGVRPGAHDNTSKVQQTKFLVLAVNREDGKVLWQTTVRDQAPHESRHETGSYASASPITDGERIYAFFGSNGLYCLDWNGEVLWEKDLGEMHSKHGHGEGSSPTLFTDTLVVNWDHEGPSFVAAFDKRTGKELWRKDRDEPTSWSSPHVVVHDGKPQVVISAANRIRSYDLGTGELIWECGGLSHNVVAGPVSEDGFVICGSSYEKQAILGIDLDGAKGDITGTDQVAWIKRHDTPYVPSLLLYQDHIYYLRHYQGVLTCLKVKTGEEVYARARLPGIGNVYASPVAANGRIYLTSLEGNTLVFSAGANPDVISINRLDDSFSASAALVGKELFLRGDEFLYCIAEE